MKNAAHPFALQYTFPMPQFIYTMKGLGKVYPPDAKVLDDIWLSFLPGAKIGVLGLNGAGKSSLLKIMAGDDHTFLGEAFPADGISVGFLQQEPKLDPAKTVLGNVEEGVADVRALLNRYDEVNARLGEDLSPEAMEKVLDEQSRIQDTIANTVSRSTSYLAAPAFAAAVLDQKVLRTIAVGRHVLLLADVTAEEGGLIGTHLASVHQPALLRVIALRPVAIDAVDWSPAPDYVIGAGDSVVVLATRAGLSSLLRRDDAAPTTTGPSSTSGI